MLDKIGPWTEDLAAGRMKGLEPPFPREKPEGPEKKKGDLSHFIAELSLFGKIS